MKFSQRIIGYGSVILGAISVLVGALPWFGVQVEAYAVGIVFFATGAWILAGPELRDTARRALAVAREARHASRRTTRRPGREPVIIDPLLPVRILRLAREQGGTLTVAQVAMELTVPLDHAEAGLNECVRAGNAIPDYDIPRAHALYRFPEFTAPDPPRLSS
jgi:hypothetical protein